MLATTTDHGLWFMNGRIRIHVAQEDNAEGISVVEHTLPHGFGPPLHVHHDEDEIFHIMAGELKFRCGDRTSIGVVGDVICLPRGVPHGFRVMSSDGARVLTVTRGRFETMLRAASRPADHAGMPENVPPTIKQQALLAHVCAINGIDLLGPPIA